MFAWFPTLKPGARSGIDRDNPVERREMTILEQSGRPGKANQTIIDLQSWLSAWPSQPAPVWQGGLARSEHWAWSNYKVRTIINIPTHWQASVSGWTPTSYAAHYTMATDGDSWPTCLWRCWSCGGLECGGFEGQRAITDPCYDHCGGTWCLSRVWTGWWQAPGRAGPGAEEEAVNQWSSGGRLCPNVLTD